MSNTFNYIQGWTIQETKAILEASARVDDTYTVLRRFHVLEYIDSRLQAIGRITEIDPENEFPAKVRQKYDEYLAVSIARITSAYEFKLNSILAGGMHGRKSGRVIVYDLAKFVMENYLETQGMNPEYDMEYDGESIIFRLRFFMPGSGAGRAA